MRRFKWMVYVGFLVSFSFLAGCQTAGDLQMDVVNEGTQSVRLTQHDSKGYTQLDPGGRTSVQPYGWEGDLPADGGAAFIGKGGAGVISLAGSSFFINDIEVSVGSRVEVTNLGPEEVHMVYTTLDGRKLLLKLGTGAVGFIDSDRPFHLNGLLCRVSERR